MIFIHTYPKKIIFIKSTTRNRSSILDGISRICVCEQLQYAISSKEYQ